MTLFDQCLQLLITGITVGSIYALVAIGFNIIYNATDVLNFAQGEFVMLGGMSMIMFHESFGISMPLSFVLAVGLVTIVGVLFERLTISPLKQPSLVTMILITIAVSILLKGFAMISWGKDSYPLEPFSSASPIRIGGAVIIPQIIWVIGITLVVVLLLTYFYKFTMHGKALRACAINREAASCMGINVKAMITLSFAMSAAIGAIAGTLITPITLMEYDRGAMLGIKGFSSAIVGGVGNSLGAVVAGLTIGIVESFAAGFVSSGYKDAFAFLILLLVLFLRPGGLLGRYEVE
ncbi:MAG: branched-chain amino acid ABC transporter permease [Deltaproteobacteria bacterium]|nr:branched-chain amino acid ABC transporter permease [Deltaproteobacteria bacterium]